MSTAEAVAPAQGFARGPLPGVAYPIRVLYCGNCSLPLEVSQLKNALL
jgi:hypothetical protein